MGGPLPGFHNTSHLEEEQLRKYNDQFQMQGSLASVTKPGGWITQIDEILAEEQKANPDLNVHYFSFPLWAARIFKDFEIDINLAVLSLILVGLFMWVQIGSAFLTIFGMFSIVMSFVLTLPTWKLFGNEALSFMQVLVLYIILGIGADDIFVFCDAWKQSRSHPEASGSIEKRLQWSWSRAMKAMTVTSLTTGSAFMLTASSDIPQISTFGTFAAVVVFWVYILTITWFPALVVIHERYVVQARWPSPGFFASHCCGCMLPICGHQWALQKGSAVMPETDDVISIKPPSTLKRADTFKNIDTMRAPERFFHKTWSGLLKQQHVRVAFIVAFVLAFVVGAVLASTQVEVTKKLTLEAFMKKGHPLQTVLDIVYGSNPAFAATDDDFKQLGH